MLRKRHICVMINASEVIYMENIGERIKRLRSKKNMTLEELGNQVGVGKSTVRKWETGMIANMRRDKIAKLADALDVSPAYLMGWKDNSMESNQTASSLTHCQTKDEESLVLSYRELNDINKKKSITYAKNLLSTQHMENELLAAHQRTDIEVTSEGIQNDLDIMNDDSLWK